MSVAEGNNARLMGGWWNKWVCVCMCECACMWESMCLCCLCTCMHNSPAVAVILMLSLANVFIILWINASSEGLELELLLTQARMLACSIWQAIKEDRCTVDLKVPLCPKHSTCLNINRIDSHYHDGPLYQWRDTDPREKMDIAQDSYCCVLH